MNLSKSCNFLCISFPCLQNVASTTSFSSPFIGFLCLELCIVSQGIAVEYLDNHYHMDTLILNGA